MKKVPILLSSYTQLITNLYKLNYLPSKDPIELEYV